MISIWLTPSKKDECYLQNIINELASEHQAPVFSPHMTLLSPVDLNENELHSVFSNVSKEFEPLNVTLAGINHSPNIWKTVFVELEESLELITLQQQIASQLSSTPLYEFLPHISLIYKDLPQEKKEEIIRKLAVRNSYKMDKITAMRTGPHVEKWERLAEIN